MMPWPGSSGRNLQDPEQDTPILQMARIELRPYSTVSFVRCNGGFFTADVIFNFNITYRSPALFGNHYSSYQLFLYQTISEHREKELTFDAIADWFNKEGYLTLRGKRFKGAHVHSILRKRLAKEELLKREYPAIWSDFSLEVVDKTILMSDSGSFSFSIKKV
jgi:hypothetical protein